MGSLYHVNLWQETTVLGKAGVKFVQGTAVEDADVNDNVDSDGPGDDIKPNDDKPELFHTNREIFLLGSKQLGIAEDKRVQEKIISSLKAVGEGNILP